MKADSMILTSILRNTGVKQLRPRINPALHVHHIGKTMVRKIQGDLLAADAMVAQTGDWLISSVIFLEFNQLRRDALHGGMQQCEAIWRNRRRLQFPELAHIQHDWCGVRFGVGRGVEPTGEFGGADLGNHD